MKDVQSVVKHIIALRKNLQISQGVLAKEAGISIRKYQRLESGEAVPRLDDLFAILKFLKIDPLHFFLGVYENDENYRAAADEVASRLDSLLKQEITFVDKPDVISGLEVEGIKQALANTPGDRVGYWQWNMNKMTYYYSKEVYAIYDIKEFSPIQIHTTYKERIHPDDYPNVEAGIHLLVKTGLPVQGVHRVRTSGNGGWKRVQGMTRILRAESGDLVSFGVVKEVE